jgi:trk system potassium uptake protein TrkA
MKIIVFGCGRVGAYLATCLSQAGHRVTVIDRNPRAFKMLGDEFTGDTIMGLGIDEDVLRRAGIEGTEAFAAVTDGDNTNIMSCLIAKEVFGVPMVVARINDPGREKIYNELGLITICPTTAGAQTILGLLTKKATEFQSQNHDL